MENELIITGSVSHLPVMQTCCRSCPFNPAHEENPKVNELKAEVMRRSLHLQVQQVCHSTEGSNREPKTRCRGAQDFLNNVFFRLGVLESPTDIAWEEAKRRQGID